MVDLRIQIVNYKTKKYLIECLKSLFKDLQDVAFTHAVAILDNASGDDLSDINALFPEKHIEIVMGEKNLGFGGGHNLLARNKEARYLLVLNPDVVLIEPDTIDRLIKELQRMSSGVVVGPRLVTSEHKTQRWDHGELEGIFAQAAMAMGKRYWREGKTPLPVAWVSGAVFLIDKKSFDGLGGFDENFFLYKEEEDLCLRVRQEGGVILYDPTITVLHYGSVVAKKSEYMDASEKYFREKHLGAKRTGV